MQDLHLLLQPFQQPHLRIVAGQDAARAGELHEHGHERREQPIHALRQRLQHQHIVVAIDDERREQIGFAVDQPAGGGVEVEGRAEREGGFQPRAPERRVHRRSPLETMRRTIWDRSLNSAWPSVRSLAPSDAHDARRPGIDVADVGAVDPGMSGTDAVLAAGR